MKLKEARKKYPDLLVISQVEQLQEFTDAENGKVILPQSIIAVKLPDRCEIAGGSIICDGCLVGKRCDFGTDCCFGVGCRFGSDCWFGFDGVFGSDCWFGVGCRFGSDCWFGSGCRFGAECIFFSSDCRFGDRCEFGAGCYFGAGCEFIGHCRFGGSCRFGSGCRFGDDCHFGASAEIGSDCDFGAGCRFGYFVGMPLWYAGAIGSRNGTTYFFVNNNGIYVVCGCYSGFIDDFEARVESVHKDNELYLSQYREAIATARDKYNEWLHNKNKRGEK